MTPPAFLQPKRVSCPSNIFRPGLRHDEAVAGIDLLVGEQNLLNVVGVRGAFGKGVLVHLVQIGESVTAVDFDVGNEFGNFGAVDGELKIAVGFGRLETYPRREAYELWREVMQLAGDFMEEAGFNVVP